MLINTLQRLKQAGSCTSILVTHKPQLLNTVDKILMLRNGQAVMFGPKQEVFQKLSQAQTFQNENVHPLHVHG